jgi:hypothetical protein
MKKVLVLTTLALLLATPAMFGQGSPTANASLSVTVGAEAGISVVSTPAFTETGTFTDYTGTTTFTYWIRTGSGATSGGTITVYISTDFSTGGTNGGPSVQHPPNVGDTLTYTTTMTAPVEGSATAVNGTAAYGSASATNVATFAKSTSSAKAGTTGNTVAWTLVDDPVYPAGTYTATATFTISAS